MDSIDVKFTVKEKVKGNISAKGTVSGLIYPKGPKGDTGTGIESIVQNEDYTLTITMTDGTSVTTSSIRGLTGNGIVSIEKTSTEGLIDTYTITYTDGNTSNFTVTNANTGSAYTKTEVDGLLEVLSEADSQITQELNNLDNKFSNNINQVNTKIDNLTHKYHIDVTETIDSDTNITLPFYYKVGSDCMDVYMCEHLLLKTTTEKEGNYREIRRNWKYI